MDSWREELDVELDEEELDEEELDHLEKLWMDTEELFCLKEEQEELEEEEEEEELDEEEEEEEEEEEIQEEGEGGFRRSLTRSLSLEELPSGAY
ncbi:hypothetical protein RI054_02g11680 [Pseudoscourfieldia marina]